MTWYQRTPMSLHIFSLTLSLSLSLSVSIVLIVNIGVFPNKGVPRLLEKDVVYGMWEHSHFKLDSKSQIFSTSVVRIRYTISSAGRELVTLLHSM